MNLRKIVSFLFVLQIVFGLSIHNAKGVTPSRVVTQQTINKITGQIVDENGNPMPGVSVVIKGTHTGTATNIDGKFELNATKGDILLVSFIGMESQEIKVEKNNYKIILKEERVAIQEVVITGYGAKKKEEYTGASVTVKKDKLEQVPVPSVEQVLQGNVAGLSSVAVSGQPGAMQEMSIRGIGSISASNTPLYVIDGVPVISGDLSRNTPTANVLSNLNSNDIESINVLKDAAATTLYGARGANGVIVITTKRGRQGKTTFDFNAEFGINQIAVDEQETLNSTEWEELLIEGLKNGKDANLIGSMGYPTAKDLWVTGYGQPDYDTSINTDWKDVVMRDMAQQHQYNLSMKGGNNKTNFFTSLGYFKQEGIVKNSDYERVSGMLNLNHRASEKVSVQTSLNISSATQNSQVEGGYFASPMMARYFLLPTDPAYNEDGTPYIPEDGTMKNGNFNIAALMAYDRKATYTTKMFGNAQMFYRPIENLKYTCKIGLDFVNIKEREHQNPMHGDGYYVGGRQTDLNTENFNWVLQNMVDYHWDLNENHKFDFKALYEAQKNKNYGMNGIGERVGSTGLYYLTSYSLPLFVYSVGSEWTSVSSMFNVSYNYASKLSADATIRREGSSRFAPGNKYGTFWSAGLSYVLSKEQFIQNIPFINSLKVRTSYGVNGNAGIGSNQYLALLSFSGKYNNYPATSNSGVVNDDLKWEKNSPFNFGIDFEVLSHRISGSIDYFHRTTSDLLLSVPVTRTSGNVSIPKNVGEMVNKGLEFTLSTLNLKYGGFQWTTDFNVTKIDNEVTKLYKDATGKSVVVSTNSKITREGETINAWYLKEWAGVNPMNGKPLWWVYNRDENGKIVSKKRTSDYSKATQELSGQAMPKIYGGMTNTFRYKGLSLSVQLNYSFGYKILDSWSNYLMHDGKHIGAAAGYKELLNRWQKPGDVTDVPINIAGNTNRSNQLSTRFLYDGDHIRVRNLMLGYNLPKRWLSNSQVSNVNLYVRGTNLFTYKFDKDLNFDPEVGRSGLIDFTLPIMKSITFGAKINF